MKQALSLIGLLILSSRAMASEPSDRSQTADYKAVRLTTISCQAGRDVSSSFTFETGEKNILGYYKTKSLGLTYDQCLQLMSQAGVSVEVYGESHADISTLKDPYSKDPELENVVRIDNIKNSRGLP